MKHWKRILSALLISAFALTLFTGCDKKVKLEDELFNQMADYGETIGYTVEKEKDNHIAESALQYISANWSQPMSANFFIKKYKPEGSKFYVTTESDEKKALFALLPDSSTSWYRISWTKIPSDPKSQYYKDPKVIAAAVMQDAFIEGTNSYEAFNSSLTFEDTIHVSIAQGKIGGYTYCLVIQRRSSVN